MQTEIIFEGKENYDNGMNRGGTLGLTQSAYKRSDSNNAKQRVKISYFNI